MTPLTPCCDVLFLDIQGYDYIDLAHYKAGFFSFLSVGALTKFKWEGCCDD